MADLKTSRTKGSPSGRENKFKDPAWTGKFGLTAGLIIVLFDVIWVFSFKRHTPSAYISAAPVIIGGIGVYYAIKKGAGFRVFMMNIFAIMIGILAPLMERYLLKILKS